MRVYIRNLSDPKKLPSYVRKHPQFRVYGDAAMIGSPSADLTPEEAERFRAELVAFGFDAVVGEPMKLDSWPVPTGSGTVYY